MPLKPLFEIFELYWIKNIFTSFKELQVMLGQSTVVCPHSLIYSFSHQAFIPPTKPKYSHEGHWIHRRKGTGQQRYSPASGTLNMPPSAPVTADYLSLPRFPVDVPSNATLLLNPNLFMHRSCTLSVVKITSPLIVFDTYQVITKVW